MGTTSDPNKAKIAKRIIEVFEFFEQHGQNLTVRDIVHRYGRPQSSTSELLASLVDMGLLYKEPRSRYYTPTPRLASFGASCQPELIREGRLFPFMDRLARKTRRCIVLLGIVGTRVEIFRMNPGKDEILEGIKCGSSERLSASAAGLLLLSTLPAEDSGKILWRLDAESTEKQLLSSGKKKELISLYRQQGHAAGVAGFSVGLQLVATLLPRSTLERPLALGIIYTPASPIDVDAFLATLDRGIADLVGKHGEIDHPQSRTPFRMAC